MMRRTSLTKLVAVLGFGVLSCNGGGGSNGDNGTEGGMSGGSAGEDGVGGDGGGGNGSGGGGAGGDGGNSNTTATGTDTGGSDGSGGSDPDGAGGASTSSATGGSAGMGGASTTTGGSAGMGGTSTTGGTGGGTTGGTGGGTTGGEPVVDLQITIDPAASHRTISPKIYGMNGAEEALDAGATLVRFGGVPENVVSGYNWEVNATHQSVCGPEPTDEYYDNSALGEGSEPGDAASSVLDVAEQNGGAAMIPIPIGEYVAADSLAESVIDTDDYMTTRFRANVAAKGTAFATPPDTADEFVYQDEFVNWVMTEAGSTDVVFALDHHPELWEYEVCLIHPDEASYADVVDTNTEFATAIKDVWSDVEIAGPGHYGWRAYVSLQNNAEDWETEGEFVDYYLANMAANSATYGRRLIDYLDLHWYPETYVEGVRIVEDVSTPAMAEARMQAPRSLWDPGYNEGNWINSDLGLEPIDLISRMQDKINANYPGTKLAISAWYYGGGSHISGAIAAADVLGIFGRERVGLASVWLPGPAPYVSEAFRVFLNYDGAGAHFGDISVSASTDDIPGASAYASIDSTDEERLVIVLLNKRSNEREANITIAGDTMYSQSLVYELTGDAATLSGPTTLDTDTANSFSYTMPALSIAVLVPQVDS